MVRLFLTISNYRGPKVCRVLRHAFGVVQAHRTFSKHIIAEIATCVEFFHMSSVWFDCTEPSLTTSLQGTQGVQGAYAIVLGGSHASNLLEPHK